VVNLLVDADAAEVLKPESQHFSHKLAMRSAYPPTSEQGFTLFFTGLSGAGKSTLAKIIYSKLVEDGFRPVILLDGDIVRFHLSSELGFSKAHPSLNINRIGFVAKPPETCEARDSKGLYAKIRRGEIPNSPLSAIRMRFPSIRTCRWIPPA